MPAEKAGHTRSSAEADTKMLGRIFTSNWFAIPVLLIAAGSLALLYLAGRTEEAIVGAVVLAVAALFILLGREKKDRDADLP